MLRHLAVSGNRHLRFCRSKQQEGEVGQWRHSKANDTTTGGSYQINSTLFRRSQARSYRPRFITLFHAATKSFTKASFESSQA